MADIKQAAKWLAEGLKVRRSTWQLESYLVVNEFDAFTFGPSKACIDTHKGEIYLQFSPNTLLGDNWELFEE